MQRDLNIVSPDANLMILKLYAHLQGLNLETGQLAHLFAEPGRPFDMARLLMALDALGFEARPEKGGLGRLEQASLPVIAELRAGGWMLVGRVDAQGVVVQRAGQDQPELISRSDFEALWSGTWAAARRASSMEKPGCFGVGWFWQAIGKHRAVLGEVLLASFFVQIFALVTPLVFQVVIDKVLTHRSLTTLDVLVVALLGLSIFEVVLSAMRHYLFSHTTNRVDVELGAKLFRHLLHLPLAYFESRRAGDTVARMRELENARNFLTGQTLTSWVDLFFAVVFLAVMFYYSPLLAGIVLAFMPAFLAASWVITPLLRRKLEDKFALGAENQAFLVETVTSMETLKGLAREPHWQREWEQRLADYVQAAFQGGHLANVTNQVIGFVGKAMTVVLLWVGAKLVIDGELTVGGLIAFNMLAARVNAPILKLASLWQDFTQMKVSVRRLADIMDTAAEPAFRPHRASLPEISGRVGFEHVTFRYQPDGPEVLSDVSFVAEPGEVIGLVGISGAGKTTLVRLLQRLYTPERGRVTVDGVDLSLVDTSWLRRQIGVVSQDTVLFNRSVRENIALADPSLSMEAIMDAAKLAGAHDFILGLPEGYDTLVGERGSRLSGGQRARIAIARALATNPRLLILDEATASLDYESERAIHNNMEKICRERTVFIVAHRLPTLRLAHRVLVLERGRLIEEGSHKELMTRAGRYHSLYKMHLALEGTHV